MDEGTSFEKSFAALTGHAPFSWQRRLFVEHFLRGDIPAALDIPTGLGKTSVIAIWYLALEAGAAIPRRLVYVVDRRVVVDQATTVAEAIRKQSGDDSLRLSTLRGQHVDNREWLADPIAPAIIVGTVDMIGSRLLFSGYGVSRKMRPYHAGLLGADAFVVLDEEHLVPPFAHLLRAVEGAASLWPEDRAPLPSFTVLPLSATQRGRFAEGNGRTPFGLEEEDWRDKMASQRLNARKQLRVEPMAEKDHDRQLAEAALALATKGPPARIVVFCNRREKKDDGAGPSAQGVAEAIEILAKGDKKAGSEKIDIDRPELLVGARRVYEREKVVRRLRELGFMDQREPAERPAFLVATSAGEVGVDVDADHMVCDLVPWERMVQRLGRVNRRGGEGRLARVVVFDTSEIEKEETRKGFLTATRGLLKLIETDFGGKVGPATLLQLRGRVGPQEIEKASTPEPLHPALTRALIDAWSMTSLDRHTGRPEVAPWLRGWVEEKPQTIVVWRKYLPLRIGDGGQAIFSSEKETNEFFDAAPPRESEKLETETFRIVEWLRDRADTLLHRKVSKDSAESTDRYELSADDAGESVVAPQPAKEWQRGDVAALILSPSAEYERCLTLGELAQDRKSRAKEDFHGVLAGKILVIDSDLGGLTTDGLLDDKADDEPPTVDALDDWSKQAGFRVRREDKEHQKERVQDWPPETEFIVHRDADGEWAERLIIEHFKDVSQSEDARSVSDPQELGKHQSCAEQKARKIAAGVGLSGVAAEALALAALLHDEGKRALRWQRAFRARHDAKRYGLSGPLAKTRGPIDQAILDGYRHEFGSLAIFEPGSTWEEQLPADVRKRIDDLPEDWRDLVLHLIAAHHGFARPVISMSGCEDGPPSALEERARDVALRFAKLQKHWGPWGLAWWEALLRAADQQASRDSDDAGKTAAAPDTEKV